MYLPNRTLSSAEAFLFLCLFIVLYDVLADIEAHGGSWEVEISEEKPLLYSAFKRERFRGRGLAWRYL